MFFIKDKSFSYHLAASFFRGFIASLTIMVGIWTANRFNETLLFLPFFSSAILTIRLCCEDYLELKRRFHNLSWKYYGIFVGISIYHAQEVYTIFTRDYGNLMSEEKFLIGIWLVQILIVVPFVEWNVSKMIMKQCDISKSYYAESNYTDLMEESRSKKRKTAEVFLDGAMGTS